MASKTYRKFNGKLYEKEQTVWSKREANNVADKLRQRGFNARIVQEKTKPFGTTGESWIVYTRKTKKSK